MTRRDRLRGHDHESPSHRSREAPSPDDRRRRSRAGRTPQHDRVVRGSHSGGCGGERGEQLVHRPRTRGALRRWQPARELPDLPARQSCQVRRANEHPARSSSQSSYRRIFNERRVVLLWRHDRNLRRVVDLRLRPRPGPTGARQLGQCPGGVRLGVE